MTQTQDKYRIKLTILSKLLIVFISFILIPMLFVGYASFMSAKSALTKAQISKLEAIADLKVDKIISYFRQLDAEMMMAQDFWDIKKTMPMLSVYTHDKSNSTYLAMEQALDDKFKIFQKIDQYINFGLLSPEGELVYEFNHEDRPEIDWIRAWENIVANPKIEIYHSPIFQYGKTTKRYGMMIGIPVFDGKGKSIGVIVVKIDMSSMYGSIQDSTGLGETGETLIVQKKGNRVVYLNPLRYDKNAAFNRIIEIGSVEGIAAKYATDGRNGAGIVTDYRGKQALAVWRYIPLLNLVLITKIDTDEAFATINSLERFLLFLVIISLLSGTLAAFTVAKSIAGPIHKLHKGTDIIASGNLDYKVGTEVPDEIGQLSRSFDEMMASLKKVTASRDDLNQAIEERKKIEEELIIAKQAAESANKAKSEFLSMMSHEFRTPLNAIIGFSEVLVDEITGTLNEKQKEYVTDVINSGQHMLSLVNDVLDISKVEAGKMELKLSEINVKSLVDNSIVMIKEKAMNHNIKLIENVSEGISNIQADERKMKQIMYNLLSNAVKFTPDGGTVGIEVRKMNNNEILITIWDTGIGIEEKDKGKIFVEFKQIDSELSRKYTGTGLGLALAKKLVELHGGKIWFDSQGKDKGSKFSFTIPIEQKNVAS